MQYCVILSWELIKIIIYPRALWSSSTRHLSHHPTCQSASDPQYTIYSLLYLIPINFSWCPRQVELIVTYDSFEALRSLQVHQVIVPIRLKPFCIWRLWLDRLNLLLIFHNQFDNLSLYKSYDWSILVDCVIFLDQFEKFSSLLETWLVFQVDSLIFLVQFDLRSSDVIGPIVFIALLTRSDTIAPVHTRKGSLTYKDDPTVDLSLEDLPTSNDQGLVKSSLRITVGGMRPLQIQKILFFIFMRIYEGNYLRKPLLSLQGIILAFSILQPKY